MARPDLPAGLGGWQALDATPQETSCGLYCCGPASVEAIRNGMVYLKYDAPFIFAEVNSDKVFWQRQLDGTFQKVLVQKKAVGHQISTKAVGSDEREDITDSYKYSEGTDEERIAVEMACRHGSRPDTYADQWRAEDVAVTVRTDDGIVMGSDFVVMVAVVNGSSECRCLRLFTQAAVMYYTGVTKGTFKKDKRDVLLEPREEKEVKLLFHYDDYQQYLVDQAAMMFTVTGRVEETGQAIVNQHNFRLRTPDLRLTPLGEAVVGKQMKVEIVLTNPLPKTLKDVTLRIEGPGLQRPRKINIGDVPRHATITITESLVPTKPGQRKLIASLDSQQLTQVHGVAEVIVQES
uniref:protein-glutamine gamma-glutamyltransferase K-like n=1 Tax=Pristiophorus japonicus TaxID=55135 RepID=UPI00398E4758